MTKKTWIPAFAGMTNLGFSNSAISVLDIWVAVFCAAVWALGLLYSYLPHWYVMQNAIVAVCSSSPILAATVHERKIGSQPMLIFLALFFIILTREVCKDIEDQCVDEGYKATVPVVNGHAAATLYVISLTFLWPACLVFYPNPVVQLVALMAGVSQFANSLLLLSPERVDAAKRMLNWAIRFLLLGILITQ